MFTCLKRLPFFSFELLNTFLSEVHIKIRANVDNQGEKKINLKEVPTLGGTSCLSSFFFACS